MTRFPVWVVLAAACGRPAVTTETTVQAEPTPAWRLTERSAGEALRDPALHAQTEVLVWEPAPPTAPRQPVGPPARGRLILEAPDQVRVGEQFEATARLDGAAGGPYEIRILPGDGYEPAGPDRMITTGDQPARFALRATVTGRIVLRATAYRLRD